MTDIRRILHVEDDPNLADVVATFLEQEDETFEVETVATASAGLEFVADHEVDCILSDYEMPGQSGIEFLKAVREDDPTLPFILFTGKGSEEIASEAISAGVTDYLQKESGTSQYAILANRIRNAVERYRSRWAVERAERKLSSIAEKSDDILFMFSRDWSELHFVNSAYEEIWGRSTDDLRENPESFLEYIHPDDQESVIRSMDCLSNGDPDEIEYQVVRPDGEERWVRADAKPIFDEQNEVSRIVGLVSDITEHRDRKRELEQISARFQTLLEHRSDIVTVIDAEGLIQYQSPAIEHVLGYSPSDLVGENAFEYIHPDDRDTAWEVFAQTIEGPGTTTDRFEYRFECADGSWTWLETIGSNKTGSAVDGFVLTSREVTRSAP